MTLMYSVWAFSDLMTGPVLAGSPEVCGIPDWSGLTAERRKRLEEVRIRAADPFQKDMKVPCAAGSYR